MKIPWTALYQDSSLLSRNPSVPRKKKKLKIYPRYKKNGKLHSEEEIDSHMKGTCKVSSWVAWCKFIVLVHVISGRWWRIQGQPQLQSKFKDSLVSMKQQTNKHRTRFFRWGILKVRDKKIVLEFLSSRQ